MKKSLSACLLVLIMLLSGCGSDSTTTTTTPAGPTVTTYSISGTITSGGVGLGTVTVTLSGAASKTASTNSNGVYTFTGLSNGNYTVTPSKTGYAFNPTNQAVNINNQSVTGKNFVGTNVGTTYSLSGNVTISGGGALGNVTMVLSGPSTGTTTTNSSGNYTFSGLQNGNYTVTPSKSGYSFNPTSQAVTVNNANMPSINFTATAVPAPTAYSISGTVNYAGTKTGRVYINVMWSGGGDTSFGNSITLSGASGTYTIRGVQPGTYTVSAYMDNLGKGSRNASNPLGNSSVINIISSNITGANITLTDPALPGSISAPTGVFASPANGMALIFWDTVSDVFGNELADNYKVFWSTSPTFASNVSNATVPARDDAHYFATGLADGTDYYFKVVAMMGGVQSPESAIAGPITIGATTGLNTISGTVTFSSVSGPLYAGAYSETTGIYITRIESPSSPQAFSVSGVPNGSYFAFAIIDVNSNGIIDLGDLSNTEGGGNMSMVTLNNSNATVNHTLTASNSQTSLSTNHWKSGNNDSYNVDIRVGMGRKLPVKVSITAGPNIAVPVDLGNRWGRGEFDAWFNTNNTRPLVGDTYTLNVTYSDGTSENMNVVVTTVLDSFAQNLSPTSTGSGITTPTFTWSAPSSPPSSYTYRLQVNDNTGNNIWEYPKDTLMPSTQTSVVYNVDGTASQPSLTGGTTYNWSVSVMDDQRNSATIQVQYTP